MLAKKASMWSAWLNELKGFGMNKTTIIIIEASAMLTGAALNIKY